MSRTILWIFAGIVGAVIVYFIVLSVMSHRDRQAGLVDGKLRPCPPTPNCVSSEAAADSARRVEPLSFETDPDAAWNALERAVESAGGTVRQRTANYLWATFETPLFRFVDDFEARMDDRGGVIHLRSASRVGRSDFGANRKRVTEIRRAFEALQADQGISE